MLSSLQINRLHCSQPSPPPQPSPNTTALCPGWETSCNGLNFPLGNGVYSFRDFNVISFADFNAVTGDIEGRLAAKGNVNLGAGFSIGYELQTVNNQPDNDLPYSLVAGGNVNWVSGALFPDGSGSPYPGDEEDMFVGGTFNGESYFNDRLAGPCAAAGCLDTYFNAAYECYSGYQSTLAALEENVSFNITWDALILYCAESTATQYVFTITPEQMTQYTYTLVENCNFQASWVINVAGTADVNITGGSFPAIPGGVVYNILGSGRTITVIDTQVNGAILSPDNTLYQPGGVIVGKVVVGDVSMSLQINKEDTCPTPLPVQLPNIPTQPIADDKMAKMVVNGGWQSGDYATQLGAWVTNVQDGWVTFDRPVTLSQGQAITVTVSSVQGRNTQSVVPVTSSSSMVQITIALLFALVALAF